jgi:hypothetical protein
MGFDPQAYFDPEVKTTASSVQQQHLNNQRDAHVGARSTVKLTANGGGN